MTARFFLVLACARALRAPCGTSPRLASTRRGTATVTPSTEASARAYLGDVPQGAPDAILGIAQAFKACTAPGKVNVAIGAYRDDDGAPYVLPSVIAAEERLLARGEKKEYAPIDGTAAFVSRALGFAYGEDCEALASGRVAGVQTLSGTGALRIAGEFYQRFPVSYTHLTLPTILLV